MLALLSFGSCHRCDRSASPATVRSDMWCSKFGGQMDLRRKLGGCADLICKPGGWVDLSSNGVTDTMTETKNDRVCAASHKCLTGTTANSFGIISIDNSLATQ